MNKIAVRQNIEDAVRLTHIKYPLFLGIYIYGSFVTSEPNPNDVDVVPVFRTYSGDISDICNLFDFFELHFPELPRDQWAREKNGYVRKTIIHAGSGILSLSDKKDFSDKLAYLGLKPESFIGTPEAMQIIRSAIAV